VKRIKDYQIEFVKDSGGQNTCLFCCFGNQDQDECPTIGSGGELACNIDVKNSGYFVIRESPNISPKDEWEMFQDDVYYGMFAVRQKNDRQFNSPRLFHFEKKEDAEMFLIYVQRAK
jgi:hypothetical protein